MDKSAWSSSARPGKAAIAKLQINTENLRRMHVPFSEKVRKIDREPVTLSWVQRTGVAVNRKLNAGLNTDRSIHAQQARSEKKLLCASARHFDALPLQQARPLTRELCKNTPIPARVIGAPRERTIAVHRR